MQSPPGATTTQNPQLILARDLVLQVTRDIQSLLPEARRRGFATVTAARLQGWQNDLRAAVAALQRIPTILIFPPPPITRFIQGAIAEIERALAILGRIPVTPPRRFPPQPGVARIPLLTLEVILGHLFRALGFLNAALRIS